MEPIEEVNGLDLKSYLPAKWYEFLKWANLIGIPAFVTLYLGLAPIWNLPGAEKVAGTAAALMTLMGVLLGVSQNRYNKLVQAGEHGTVVVTETADGGVKYDLQVAAPIDKLKDLSELKFDVKKAS